MSVAYLLELSRELSQAESPPNLEEVAAVALKLAAIHSEIAEHLEPLKEYLRTEAAHDRIGTSNKVVVAGLLGDQAFGEVQITYPEAVLKIPKGTDERFLREQLGDLFDEAFQTVKTVKPRKDLRARLKARAASAAPSPQGGSGEPRSRLDAVLQYLDMVEPTPRVGFRPAPGILSDEL